METKNKSMVLLSRPIGEVTAEVFGIKEIPVPDIGDGELLVKSEYISVDPYMRGRMNDYKSYAVPFEINRPIYGNIIGKVVETKSKRFHNGDFVRGVFNWQLYNKVNENDADRLEADIEPITAYLGALGMTGLTAYFGLLDIGTPDKGETVVISGAAGAVGSVAGQIALILGCRVTGITGSDDKVTFLKDTLHFDDAINYKAAHNLRKALMKACPQGIDIYFDNVGGEISDSVLYLVNNFSRIIICGQISQYNISRMPTGPRMQNIILTRRAMMKGFILRDYKDHFQNALSTMKKWYQEGKLIHSETVAEGFEKLPDAFLGLFRGDNMGKMIVHTG